MWSTTFSTILTELFSPLDVFCNVSFVYRRLDPSQGRHEIVHTHVRCTQKRWIHIHYSHVGTLRVARECRSPSAVCCLLESFTLLAFTHRHHQRFISHDSDIRTWIALWILSQNCPILICQVMSSLGRFSFKHMSPSLCLRQGNVNTLLKTATDSIVQLPWDIRSA